MAGQVRPLKVMEKMPGLIGKYWQDLKNSKKDGKLIAWSSGASPFQILKEFDIEVVWPEGYASYCSIAGVSGDLCQRAETVGYSSDLCSVVRNFIGFTHATSEAERETLPYGGLPAPDLLICQPYCPGVYKMWKDYSVFFNVPLIVMERARIHDTIDQREIDHLIASGVEELKEIILFLERFTGRRLDYEKLAQRLALEWEASEIRTEGLEMCRTIPAPMSMFDAFAQIFPFQLFRGTPAGITFYQELKAELAERVARGEGSLAGKEEYRVYWDNLPIFYKGKEISEKFASYGAVPVVATFPFNLSVHPELDWDNPLKSIVEYWLFLPNNRGLTGRIEHLTRLVDDFSLDGFVMQRSRTCLLNNMGQDDITEALTQRTGLPSVIVEGDLCDPRFYSDAEFNGKLDAFMEILAQKKNVN